MNHHIPNSDICQYIKDNDIIQISIEKQSNDYLVNTLYNHKSGSDRLIIKKLKNKSFTFNNLMNSIKETLVEIKGQ